MCWLSVVVRSPPARRSLSWIQSLLNELWLIVTEVSTLSLILLTTQTMVTTGILPLQGKIPMVEPGIEPGTSWLVVRSSDHQTTRLVRGKHDEGNRQKWQHSVPNALATEGRLPDQRGNFFSQSYPTSWYYQSFYLSTDAQKSCFKRILKFTLKQLLHVSVQSPSSGSVFFEIVKVIIIKIIS